MSSKRSLMPKKEKKRSVSEIGPSPLKVDADDADDDDDGRVGIWKAPLPDGIAELKNRTLDKISENEMITRNKTIYIYE